MNGARALVHSVFVSCLILSSAGTSRLAAIAASSMATLQPSVLEFVCARSVLNECRCIALKSATLTKFGNGELIHHGHFHKRVSGNLVRDKQLPQGFVGRTVMHNLGALEASSRGALIVSIKGLKDLTTKLLGHEGCELGDPLVKSTTS